MIRLSHVCLIALLLGSSSCVWGQSETQLVLQSDIDTSAKYAKLYTVKIGDTAQAGTATYKIIDRKVEHLFKASYIYFDGSKLTMAEIDTRRREILKKYAAGTSFRALFDKFNMDGNPNGGAVSFGEGMMVEEFEAAVQEIFR